MKKKMLFMAAIAGLISLGSCVKDDVSGSVEAVRNAKANQLNADANLKNAQAAVQQAAAELAKATQSALVAQEQASAAILQAQAQKDQLDADFDAQAFASKLEAQLATYAATVATQNTTAQQQLNALAQAMRDAALNQNRDVNILIGRWQTAFKNLTTAQRTLVGAQVDLAKAKADEELALEVASQLIDQWQREIDKQTAIIAALEELKSKGATQEEVDVMEATLQAQLMSDASEFASDPSVAAFIDAAADFAAAYLDYLAIDDAVKEANKVAQPYNAVTNPKGRGWVAAGVDYLKVIKSEATTISSNSKLPFGYYKTVGMAEKTPTKYDYDYKPTFFQYPSTTTDIKWTANITMNMYRENETVKDDVAKGLKNIVKTAKDNWDGDGLNGHTEGAKTTLEKNIDLLGSKDDKAGTKTKMELNQDAKGNQKTTLYADLAAANDAVTAASNAKEAADKALSEELGKIKEAYEALLSIVQKKPYTDKDKDWLNAVLALANSVAAAWGEPAYDPNLKKYNYLVASDLDSAVELLFGVAGKKQTDLDDKTEVEALFAGTGGIIKSWDSKAPKQNIDNLAYVTAAKSHDISKCAYADADYAAKALGTDKDKDGVNQYTNKDSKVVNTAYADVDKAKVAKKAVEDNIPTLKENAAIAEDNYYDAVNNSQETIDLFASVDLDAIKAKIEAVEKAAEAYNKAYEAVAEAAAPIFDNEAKLSAISSTTTQDIDEQIAKAKTSLAKAKGYLAEWNPGTPGAPAALGTKGDAEKAVAVAQKAVDDAEADVALYTAQLAAAQAAIEALGLDIDLDGDDEPAEEPETPEEPAEGGEETPAEGEGEAEGGEEA